METQEHKDITDQVAEIKERWDAGLSPDALSILEDYPELAAKKSAVVELVHEEFWQRLVRGEKPDIHQLASRFPRFKSTLVQQLQIQEFLADNRELYEASIQLTWPEPGQDWMGFTLLRELGRGSFSRVYLAQEKALGKRPVAIKVSTLGGGTEAEILGRLRHDNIVAVYSVNQHPINGLTIVCMPYLGTTTLCDVLDRAFADSRAPAKARVILEAVRPEDDDARFLSYLPPRRILERGSYVDGVLDIGVQLAEALAFVHGQKIFHRDLKPSNVLVRPDGRPMLLDFNLSFDQDSRERVLGGTLAYMSPEQLLATDKRYSGPSFLDARSDVYSLGVILYELLAGRHPFGSLDGSEVAVRKTLGHRQPAGPMPLRRLNPRVDKRAAGIIEKCLAYRPDDRYASAAELANDLRRSLTPVQRIGRKLPRSVWVGIFLATLAIVTLVPSLILRQPSPQQQLQRAVSALQTGEYSEALDILTRLLAQEDSIEGRRTRARVYQKLGDFRSSLLDYEVADRLDPNGQSKACIAYCYNQIEPDRPHRAVAMYKAALNLGYVRPVVYNNLGASLLEMRGGAPEAIRHIEKAIELDPKLQQAYYNRAMADLVAGRKGAVGITRRGLTCMARSFELGPASAAMHVQAACMSILGADLDPRWKENAFEHLRQAVRLGATRQQLQENGVLKQLADEPRFQDILRQPAAAVSAPQVSLILDPFDGFGDRTAQSPAP
jgi:serine/threonine protein kinase